MNYCLVTGATGVLGKTFVKSLAKSGKNLLLTGRSMERLKELKTLLEVDYPHILIEIFPADLSDETHIESLFEFADSKDIAFSGFYSVAGADVQKAFSKYTFEKVLFQTRVNYEAPLLITNKILERRADKLDILVVASSCGYLPIPYFAIYSSSKGALINFFSALRCELKGKGVRITILSPGSIPTRQDVIEDIKKQGLSGKLSAKPPEYVVKKALWGLEKNKKTVIPGFFNKVVHLLLKISPQSIKLSYAKKHWQDKEKDAF